MAVVALDGSGNVQASVLYGPYGAVRYSSGTMPGSYGYTGQHADATTGLDYYNARYYDASAGQFASADTAQDGLNRYGYVHGNPTTLSDPSGHRICPNTAGGGCTCTQDCGGGGGCTLDCGGGCLAQQYSALGSRSACGGGDGSGGKNKPHYTCDNVCVAKNLADAATQTFRDIQNGAVALGVGLPILLGLAFGAVGVFWGSIATGASIPIAWAANKVSSWFDAFSDAKAVKFGPTYFHGWYQHIVDSIGEIAVAATALGTILTSLMMTPMGALLNIGIAAAGALAATSVLAVFGFVAGAGLGGLATLFVLAPLVASYALQMSELLYGNLQDCGNDDDGTDIHCPGMA